MTLRMRMNRFQRAIASQQHKEQLRTGTTLRFTPSIRCACQDVSQQAQPDCRVCGGRGWFWIDSQEVALRGVVHDVSLNRMWQGYGFIQQGDIGVTFDQRVFVKPWDRLRLTFDELHQFDIISEAEVIVHDPEDSGSSTDTVRHRIGVMSSVVGVDYLTGAVTLYRQGVDYAAPAGENEIHWLSGVGVLTPAPLESVSVSYLADFDWAALQETAPRHVGGTGFGAPAFFSRVISDERADDARREDVPL